MESGLKPIRPVPAVNAAILDGEGRILLTLRSASVREPGKWCLPGGHFDGGEDWIGAVRREVLEEIGLRVPAPMLYGLYSDPEVTVSKHPFPEGWRPQYVVAAFLVRRHEGEVKPNSEVADWGWFRPESLPSPMVVSHPVRVADAFRFNGTVFVR